MEKLEYGGQQFVLRRFPIRADDPLRAWDAADEYLLRRLDEDRPEGPGRLLIFNDAFGALATVLHGRHPVFWSDSEMSRRALQVNLEEIGVDPAAVTFLGADQDPKGPFDTVLMKLPKSLAYWEDGLRRLRPALAFDSLVMMGGMIKHTPARAYQLLAEILGPTKTSLGWKKARLAISRLDAELSVGAAAACPTFEMKGDGMTVTSGPNVFSRERLDHGSRMLLGAVPTGDEPLRVLDIGCGNGVLALAAAKRNPAAVVKGLDESYQAVASARGNAQRARLSEENITFKVAADLSDEPGGKYDLILCNPPFHQGMALGDQLAWGMMHQARRLLAPGGRLLVVGNQHLGYHVKLKRLYGRVEVVASDRRFVVLEASGAGKPGSRFSE